MGGIGGTGGAGGEGNGPCTPQCDANAGVVSDCVALVDNAGQSNYGLRMAQFALEKPTALASPLVSGIVDDGITLNLPDCYLTGNGAFSWLLELDLATGKLKTGGAKPAADPTAGFCFVNETLGGTQVSPLVLDATPDANGKFSVAVGGDVVVPIFLTTDASSYLLLPLRSAKIVDATVSADQNCIGDYNDGKLDPADLCEPTGDVKRFDPGAGIDAHITLADADTIKIDALGGQSLCVFLTGQGEGTPKTCPKDPATGEITAKGDWCHATDSPATAACADAFKALGQFAASAVKINGDCP